MPLDVRCFSKREPEASMNHVFDFKRTIASTVQYLFSENDQESTANLLGNVLLLQL